jgi:hypothetical protein
MQDQAKYDIVARFPDYSGMYVLPKLLTEKYTSSG